MDGRIDDPNAGWKGKAIWTTDATRARFHVEGGNGTSSKVVKFQVRPDRSLSSAQTNYTVHMELIKRAESIRLRP